MGVWYGAQGITAAHRQRERNCNNDDCPNVYRTSSGSIVVQGDVSDVFQPPAGEGLVEIPESILREAVRALGW